MLISDFKIIRPEFELSQEEGIRWLAAAHAEASREPHRHDEFLGLLKKVGLGDQKILKRGVSIRDCFHRDWEKMELYPAKEKPAGAGFGKRSEVFDRVATDILARFYPSSEQLPSYLVHVTCTGYVAPSPAQKLVSLKGAGHQTIVTHAYHMGCYASIPALRIAQGNKEKTEIVHTEICSLHLNPGLHGLEQLVVQTLFADGFIKYEVSSRERSGLQIVALDERIIPDSIDAMHWVCQDWGLKMKLAKDVPVLIARALPDFVAQLRETAGKQAADVYFAIHPGGPKIIQQVGKILELKPAQYEHSLWVLQNYGNMSSATLPHIWDLLWKDEKVKDGSLIVSLAFGPGLTLAGGVFQCVR
ncbi:MAG: naringenin-chalcone synthase [Verrucomicrobia bacterium]|nr:naringenin-chalcone synthase [Verrucomicrobiota bacterium]